MLKTSWNTLGLTPDALSINIFPPIYPKIIGTTLFPHARFILHFI